MEIIELFPKLQSCLNFLHESRRSFILHPTPPYDPLFAGSSFLLDKIALLHKTRCISLLHCSCTWPGACLACRRKSGRRSRFEQETSGRLLHALTLFTSRLKKKHSSVLMRAKGESLKKTFSNSRYIFLIQLNMETVITPCWFQNSWITKFLLLTPWFYGTQFVPPDKGCDSCIKGANGWCLIQRGGGVAGQLVEQESAIWLARQGWQSGWLVGGSVSIAWQWLAWECKLLRNNFVTSRLNVTCVVRLL